jgi:hypothetical protein
MKARKRLLVAAVSLMAAAAAGPALALPSHWREWEYYSDATYSEYVGMWGQTCAGTVYKEGIQTPYRIQTMNHPC